MINELINRRTFITVKRKKNKYVEDQSNIL